jgi:hypothetical protein
MFRAGLFDSPAPFGRDGRVARFGVRRAVRLFFWGRFAAEVSINEKERSGDVDSRNSG